jgi:hypothetical protein
VSPAEVIDRMAGDCQGQAAVTCSMLLAMGFESWVQLATDFICFHSCHVSSNSIICRRWQKHLSIGGHTRAIPSVVQRWELEGSQCSFHLTLAQQSLNYHGNAGLDGNVLPQPIDMVYTNWVFTDTIS